MRRLWMRYLNLLDQDLNKEVFDNLKNFLVCALMLAAGTSALNNNHPQFMGLVASSLTGWGLIAVGVVLMIMNITDDMRRLAKLRYHVALQITVFVLYAILAIRVVTIVWNYRST